MALYRKYGLNEIDEFSIDLKRKVNDAINFETNKIKQELLQEINFILDRIIVLERKIIGRVEREKLCNKCCGREFTSHGGDKLPCIVVMELVIYEY